MADSKIDVAALVARMPDTDREIQAREDGKEVPSAPASKFTGPDPALMASVVEALLAGGDRSIAELLSLVRAPADDDYTNFKAEYVLHALCLHAGQPKRAEERKRLANGLAQAIDGGDHSVQVKGCFIRELQWIGGSEVAPVLGRQLSVEPLCSYAASALLAIGGGAVEQFRRALKEVTGANRVHIVQGLGALEDTESAPALRDVLETSEGELRLTAGWALSKIGDAVSAGLLLRSAEGMDGHERERMTDHCFRLAERLEATGKPAEAKRIYAHLSRTRVDPEEAHVRAAAERALGGEGTAL